jgi:hypothetical protein
LWERGCFHSNGVQATMIEDRLLTWRLETTVNE